MEGESARCSVWKGKTGKKEGEARSVVRKEKGRISEKIRSLIQKGKE